MDKKNRDLTPESFWEKEDPEVKEQREAQELFAPETEETAEPSREEPEDRKMRLQEEPSASPVREEEEESEADDEDEEPEDEIKKLIRLLAVIGSAVLLVVLLTVILIFVIKTRRPAVGPDESNGQESLSYEGAELLGVVLSCEENRAVVYDAVSQKTMTFDLTQARTMTDQYGQPLSAANVTAGQIVQVVYNSANGKAETFRLTSRAEEMTEVTGVAVLPDNQIQIGDKTYRYDDQLICRYRGQAWPVAQITPSMVVRASALDDHLYTLQVLYGSGVLSLQNIPKEYIGLELELTPEKGEAVTVVLKEEGQQVTITEGLVSYRVKKENLVENQGQVMVAAGTEPQVLALRTAGQRQGRILLDINALDAVVVIGEDTYPADEEILLPYGEYKAVIQAEGFDPVEITLQVTQPYRRIKVDMNAMTTRVIVSSSLSGSELYVNGELNSTLRGKEVVLELAAGTYRLTVCNEGYEDMTITVEVHANMADQVVYFTGFIPKQTPPPEESEISDGQESQEE